MICSSGIWAYVVMRGSMVIVYAVCRCGRWVDGDSYCTLCGCDECCCFFHHLRQLVCSLRYYGCCCHSVHPTYQWRMYLLCFLPLFAHSYHRLDQAYLGPTHFGSHCFRFQQVSPKRLRLIRETSTRAQHQDARSLANQQESRPSLFTIYASYCLLWGHNEEFIIKGMVYVWYACISNLHSQFLRSALVRKEKTGCCVVCRIKALSLASALSALVYQESKPTVI